MKLKCLKIELRNEYECNITVVGRKKRIQCTLKIITILGKTKQDKRRRRRRRKRRSKRMSSAETLIEER